jgi:uncharacterized cupin superfamily protein
MGDDWFVKSVRDMRWVENAMGAYCDLADGEDFPQFAINLNVLPRGSPMAIYHREPYQEGFLVLRGTCVLVVEGEELPLRQWDYFNCPPDVAHVVVGTGEEPALVLAVGHCGPEKASYPPEPLAAAYRASTDDEHDARAAYERFGPLEDVPFREEFLTG